MNAIQRNATLAAAVMLGLLAPAYAQDMPLPKLLKGIPGGEKGRWKMEVLEGTGRGASRAGMSMTVCTDNVMDLAQRRDKDTGAAGCREKMGVGASERRGVVEVRDDGEMSRGGYAAS